MKLPNSVYALFLVAVLSPFSSAWAAESNETNSAPSIRTTGDAVVSAKPDQVHINIGLVTQAPTAEAAANQNAAQTTAIIAALRASGAGALQIQTSSYSLDPMYIYPKPGGKPEIQGYTARNTVEVTTGDLAGVGKLIDKATQAGANNIQQLQFSLKDEQAARTEALRVAVERAMAKAQAIASGLGLKVIRVLSVEEGTPAMIRPMAMEAMRMQGAPQTPVEPGSLDIRATVTLKVEVGK